MQSSDIEYTDEFEYFLKSECEKMECLTILHIYECNRKIKINHFFSIPTIILSGITAILSSSNLLFTFPYGGFIIGGLCTITAILKALEKYFNFSRISETHRMTALNYNKIIKFIQVHLSLERDSRIDAKSLFNLIINDVGSIESAEPSISQNAINFFKSKYTEEKYKNIRPSILNGLTDFKINKKTVVEFKKNMSVNSFVSVKINEPLSDHPLSLNSPKS